LAFCSILLIPVLLGYAVQEILRGIPLTVQPSCGCISHRSRFTARMIAISEVGIGVSILKDLSCVKEPMDHHPIG
jgi:hypothetical protein